MNSSQSYCLKAGEEFIELVGVTEQSSGRWNVTQYYSGSRQAGLAKSLTAEMETPGSYTTWLMPKDEARTGLSVFPRLKDKETNQVVARWVAREEGGTPEDYRVYWQKCGQNKSTAKNVGQELFLLFCENKVISERMSLAEEWNITPQRMLPEHLVLDQFCRLYAGEHITDDDGEKVEAWNIVYIGRKSHFLCVSTQDSLLLTRHLPEDLSDGVDTQEYLNRLATEVDRSVSFARQTEKSPTIGRILVCGDPELASGLTDRLLETSEIKSVFWDAAEKFEWPGAEVDHEMTLHLMSAALPQDYSVVNLLSRPGRRLFSPVFMRRSFIGFGSAAAVLLPLLLVGGLITTEVQDRYLTNAKERLGAATVRADDAAVVYAEHRVLMARESVIAEHEAQMPDLQWVLLHLADIAPAQVVFRDLQIIREEDSTFRLYLSGESVAYSSGDAQQAFLNLQHALEQSKNLIMEEEPRRLEITDVDERGAKNKRVVFSLDCAINLSGQLIAQEG